MPNLKVHLPALDNSVYELVRYGESAESAIHVLFTSETVVPPISMVIEVTTHSGKIAKVVIPYSKDAETKVYVNGKEVE